MILLGLDGQSSIERNGMFQQRLDKPLMKHSVQRPCRSEWLFIPRPEMNESFITKVVVHSMRSEKLNFSINYCVGLY